MAYYVLMCYDHSISSPFTDFTYKSINQSINQFITRHSTEARATMSLLQTEKECLNSVLENVNGWSSPTAQRKRVPESWCRDRETTSSNDDVVRGTERRLCVDDRNKHD